MCLPVCLSLIGAGVDRRGKGCKRLSRLKEASHKAALVLEGPVSSLSPQDLAGERGGRVYQPLWGGAMEKEQSFFL